MRILIVGYGSIGQRHHRNLRELLGNKARVSILHRNGNLEEALSKPLDAVIVANPTSLHLESAAHALFSGLPVLVEKPLSNSWKGMESFLALDGTVLVGYQYRFHPAIKALRGKTIQSAAVTFSQYLPDWHPEEDYRISYAARKELGGGVVLCQIHDIDYLGYLFGWPEKVYSIGGRLGHLEIDVEDTAFTLWSVNGRPVSLHQDFSSRRALRRLELVLEGGDFLDIDLLHYNRNQLFLDEMRHFIAVVRGEEEPLVTAREGSKSLAVALAVLESQQSGEPAYVRY